MNKVVDFPAAAVTEEEKARRTMVEATRLANLAPGEWRLWLDRSAERLGITRDELQAAVTDIIKDKDKKRREAEVEARRIEQRAQKQQAAVQRDLKRERQRIEKDAERKRKEKNKAFAIIIKLPSDQHEAKLVDLAKRIDEDVAGLRDEFSGFIEAERSFTPSSEWYVEPWGEPVATVALLQEIIAKVTKHIVARPHEALTIALWVAFAWIHEVATHSPYLVVTSAEPDSGKTTLLGVLRFLVPKPFMSVESTGPSIFRFVDREKPTLLVDEADDLFQRKADIKHVFNAAWTRGTKIPRQMSVQGVSITVWFDPFCPKVVGLLGLNLPPTLRGRSIVIKLWPKKPEEKAESFSHADDEEFVNLRRKLARWAVDTAALKEATPLLPPNFNNRAASNWKVLLAIAECAGMGQQARDAAERLSRTARKPSSGVQLLEAMRAMFATGRNVITSEQVVGELIADPNAPWCEYNRGGSITQRQVADLLRQYDITPLVIHPTKRSTLSPRGYRAEQFRDVFDRFLPPDHPHIRTPGGKTK
jgi:Protein of unknown function (DUF3631)